MIWISCDSYVFLCISLLMRGEGSLYMGYCVNRCIQMILVIIRCFDEEYSISSNVSSSLRLIV